MGNADISSDNRENGKDHQGNGHNLWGFVNMMCHLVIDTGFAKEGQKDSPEHIESRHARSNGSNQPQENMAVGTGKGLPENFILAEKSGETGDSGNRQRGDEEGPEGDRNLLSQGPHFPHVQLTAQSVHHTPCPKKEESFKKSMRHQVKDACAERSDADP
jgi:hypothetical protein